MLSQLGDTELPSDPKWTKIFLKHFSVWTFYMFSIYGFDLKLILFYLYLLCTGQPKIYRIVFGWMQLVRFWVLNETIWIFLVFQICWCEQVLDLRLRMPRLTVMAFLVYIHTWVFNSLHCKTDCNTAATVKMHRPEADDWTFLADVALGLVFGGLCSSDTMKDR